MNATGHSCKVEDRKLTYLADKIELKSQDAVKKLIFWFKNGSNDKNRSVTTTYNFIDSDDSSWLVVKFQYGISIRKEERDLSLTFVD